MSPRPSAAASAYLSLITRVAPLAQLMSRPPSAPPAANPPVGAPGLASWGALPAAALCGVVGVALGWCASRASRPPLTVRVATGADSVVVTGTDIVVAGGGAVVHRGAHGRLTANTGAAQAGGVLALNPAGSTLTAGIATTLPNQEAESHAVRVEGVGHVVSYDDANVFVEHQGAINSNTGDTDTSAVNAVDCAEVRIEVADDGDGNSEDGDSGDDHPSSDDPDGDAPERDDPERDGIESDGIDDLTLTVLGVGHVVAEDDGTVVVGGTGQVNAQVGDADTGGIMAMGLRRTAIIRTSADPTPGRVSGPARRPTS